MFVFLLLLSPFTSSTPCDFQHCSENGGSVFYIYIFYLRFGMVYFRFNILDLILSILCVFFSLVFLMMIMSSCTICAAIPLGCEIFLKRDGGTEYMCYLIFVIWDRWCFSYLMITFSTLCYFLHCKEESGLVIFVIISTFLNEVLEVKWRLEGHKRP